MLDIGSRCQSIAYIAIVDHIDGIIGKSGVNPSLKPTFCHYANSASMAVL